MKDSNCKESFTDTCFKWLKLLIKSIPFDQVHTDNDTHCIDLLFSEKAVIKNHLEAIKQKVRECALKFYSLALSLQVGMIKALVSNCLVFGIIIINYAVLMFVLI